MGKRVSLWIKPTGGEKELESDQSQTQLKSHNHFQLRDFCLTEPVNPSRQADIILVDTANQGLVADFHLTGS